MQNWYKLRFNAWLVVLSRRLQQEPAMTLPIDMVSDVVCPWCYIGKRRLEKAIALRPDIPVEVRFRPYFLNPWVPREGMSREEYLVTKFGSPERYRAIAQRVEAAAAAEGLTYALDKIVWQPNTLDCHRLILWAGESGNAARDGGRGYGLRTVDAAIEFEPVISSKPAKALGLTFPVLQAARRQIK